MPDTPRHAELPPVPVSVTSRRPIDPILPPTVEAVIDHTAFDARVRALLAAEGRAVALGALRELADFAGARHGGRDNSITIQDVSMVANGHAQERAEPPRETVCWNCDAQTVGDPPTCRVCGASWPAKDPAPPPAEPAPEEAPLSERLRAMCKGQVAIAWPHRILHEAADRLALADLRDEVDRLTRLTSNQTAEERALAGELEKRTADLRAARAEREAIRASRLEETEALRAELRGARAALAGAWTQGRDAMIEKIRRLATVGPAAAVYMRIIPELEKLTPPSTLAPEQGADLRPGLLHAKRHMPTVSDTAIGGLPTAHEWLNAELARLGTPAQKEGR